MTRLTILEPGGISRTIELDEGQSYRLGRARKNDIVLDDPAASRHHVELYMSDDAWWLKDLDSSNGTRVDGRIVEGPIRLVPGMTVAIGDCRLRLGAADDSSTRLRLSDRPVDTSKTVMISAEQPLSDLERDPTSSSETLSSLRRRFASIERASLELTAHSPIEKLLPRIVDLIADAVGPDRTALLSGTRPDDLVCRASRCGKAEGDFTLSSSVTRRVLEERASILTTDVGTDDRFADAVSVAGLRTLMAVPLLAGDDVLGLLYVDRRAGRRPFVEDDLRLLTLLAGVAAIQIVNARLFDEQLEKRRLEREAKDAAEIQRLLLPDTMPEIPGYRLAGHSESCFEVGGDYFDVVSTAADRCICVLADVAGKGMGAALVMAGMQAALRARIDIGEPPADIVRHLDRAILRRAPEHVFVTAFFAELNPSTHRVQWINAGHSPVPLLVKADGRVVELRSRRMPLGIRADESIPTDELRLDPGDVIVVCSDGIVDTEDRHGNPFGDDRLRDTLISLAGRPADEILAALLEAVRVHRGEASPLDDSTLLVIERSA